MQHMIVADTGVPLPLRYACHAVVFGPPWQRQPEDQHVLVRLVRSKIRKKVLMGFPEVGPVCSPSTDLPGLVLQHFLHTHNVALQRRSCGILKPVTDVPQPDVLPDGQTVMVQPRYYVTVPSQTSLSGGTALPQLAGLAWVPVSSLLETPMCTGHKAILKQGLAKPVLRRSLSHPPGYVL